MVLQGQHRATAAVAVPIGHQIVGDAVQPCGYREAAFLVLRNTAHSTEKDLGGEILGIVLVARSIINVVKDPLDVLLIEQSESFMISLNCPIEAYFFTGIDQQSLSTGGSSKEKNPGD